MLSLTLFQWRNVEVAHTAWNILQTVHEGTKAIKINKLQQLTSKFESIRTFDDESFDEFYAKLKDIVNSAYNLGEIYDQSKIVWKFVIIFEWCIGQVQC